MPTHCRVPECTKKSYPREEGSKVSYFQFPSESILEKKKWINAIKRTFNRKSQSAVVISDRSNVHFNYKTTPMEAIKIDFEPAIKAH